MRERLKALRAISAFRQLKGLNLLSQEEEKEIGERITKEFGQYLSPIR